MARLFNDALTHYIEVDLAAVAAVPVTVSAWAYCDDNTITQSVVSLVNSATSNNYFELSMRGADVGDPVGFQTRDPTAGTPTAVSTTGFTTNTWAHVCGVSSAANSRAVYLNGGSKGTEGTSVSPTGINRTSIGRLGRSTPGSYFSGRIAEVAIWNAALTDAEVLALARGVSPLRIRVANLVAYWPLYGIASPEIDIRGFSLIAVSGATQVDHSPVAPPFMRPVGQRWRTAMSVGGNRVVRLRM